MIVPAGIDNGPLIATGDRAAIEGVVPRVKRAVAVAVERTDFRRRAEPGLRRRPVDGTSIPGEFDEVGRLDVGRLAGSATDDISLWILTSLSLRLFLGAGSASKSELSVSESACMRLLLSCDSFMET